jgi:lipopolysaccharide transport system permease protein
LDIDMSGDQSSQANPSEPAAAPRAPAASADRPGWLVIQPRTGWQALNLGEVWKYRELMYFLAWRDIKVRYKQTLLGGAWAVLQPLLTMVVFSVFFGGLAHVPSDGVPYPIFAFAALVPWQLFAQSLGQSAGSLITNERLITKVYFPRLLIPASSVVAALVDFAVPFVILLVMMFCYGIVPTAAAILVLPLTLLAAAAALGASLWLSALNVQYRDFRHTIPFIIQFLLFASPIAYPASMVPAGWWRTAYGLNPMASVVEGFRWALLGRSGLTAGMLAVSIATTALTLLGGLLFFRRRERTFADLV